MMADLCARHDVDPGRIVIELTESTVAADSTTLLEIVTRLRVMGFRLSIDDFGTGYSSLEQLRMLPFSELKVDRRFVQDAAHDERSRLILMSSLNLARQLALVSVAEGVESEADLDLVARLGCDVVQGYLIGKPMPAHEVSAWVAAASRDGATGLQWPERLPPQPRAARIGSRMPARCSVSAGAVSS
jgi:EAL domain-containing protein (putative c-di-GMP-specific phosphodiesterase class I)